MVAAAAERRASRREKEEGGLEVEVEVEEEEEEEEALADSADLLAVDGDENFVLLASLCSLTPHFLWAIATRLLLKACDIAVEIISNGREKTKEERQRSKRGNLRTKKKK